MNMREDLKAFVDNEISESERTRLLREIESDPSLQAEVIELRQISRILSEEAWQPEPVGLERTLGALASGGGSKKPWWIAHGFQLAFGAACTVIVAAILFPVFAQSKSAAKKSMELAAYKRAQLEETNGFDADVTAGWSPQTSASAPLPPSTMKGEVERGREGRVYASDTASPMAGANIEFGAKTPNPSRLRFEIKTAQLSVEVEDVPKAQTEAENIAKSVGGRVESSSKSNDEGTLATANLTLRVPVDTFQGAVNRLRNLGRVTSDNLTGQDVTTQVVDVEARLKVLRAEEDQYVELLKATNKIGEVLSVRERLSQVRQEIESLDATRKSLRDQSAESTIHLALAERPKPDRPQQNENWAEDTWSTAINGLSAAGRAIGKALVFLFVFSPIWLPIVMLAWWLARRANR
jgi:hypothetical protein